MSAVIEVGFGTLLLMSVRVSLKHRLLLSGLPTLRVSLFLLTTNTQKLRYIDANLFKEAFIKAQQENEALFAKA